MLYILCITTVLVFAYIADRQESKFCLFLCAIILSLFCGLRGIGTGVDTINYYKYMSMLSGSGISFGSDMGFSFVSYYLMLFLKNPYYTLLIYAFITNFLIVYRLWDFREESSYTLMLLIYLAVYYSYTFNIVRQFLAISIIFWATKYIEKEKYIKYSIFNIIASSIHTSAIMCFVFLFVTFGYRTEKRKFKIMGFGAAVLFFIAWFYSFGENITKYSNYFTSSVSTVHAMTLFKIIFFIVVMVANNTWHNDEFSVSKSGIIIPMKKQIPLIYMMGLALASMGMFFTFMNRMGFYFIVFEMPFWGQTVRAKINGGLYKLIVLAVVTYCLVTGFLSVESADNLFYYHSFLME